MIFSDGDKCWGAELFGLSLSGLNRDVSHGGKRDSQAVAGGNEGFPTGLAIPGIATPTERFDQFGLETHDAHGHHQTVIVFSFVLGEGLLAE
jgi:hypothetical protein